LKGFERTFGRADAPLHAAAHSHHPWPDVSFAAQEVAWNDAARLLDRKWDHVFGSVIPAAQSHAARVLNLPDPRTIAFGPNTHSFVLRILSCFPRGKPIRILTTGSEFMSFARQIARLEEDGDVVVTRVATEPFDTFEKRFADAASQAHFDLIFFSQVFFDSGFRVTDPAALIASVRDHDTVIVIDGYHAFMAVPVDISAIAERVFYLGGGYKYAMAGEGCCFLHCPPGYGPRPRDTGWYAGFDALEGGGAGVPFAGNGGRFLGATFDVTGLYRFNAVQDWLASESLTVPKMLSHVRAIESAFLAELGNSRGCIDGSMLLVPEENRRGRFLAFRTSRAGEIAKQLGDKNAIADHRGDRLRIGFGIYHETRDAVRLAEILREL
jgi:kynureninase